MGVYLFIYLFLQVKLIYSTAFPQKLHILNLWKHETVYSSERNNLPNIYQYMPQGKNIAYG